jgi:hypothetical protein
MHNQHGALSQTLAQQHTAKRRAQAAQARLARGARPLRRPMPVMSVRAGGSWLGGQASPWSSQSLAPARQLTSHVDPQDRCGRPAETFVQPTLEARLHDRPGGQPTGMAVLGERACL